MSGPQICTVVNVDCNHKKLKIDKLTDSVKLFAYVLYPNSPHKYIHI